MSCQSFVISMLKWNNPVQSHFCSIFKQCAESEESCRRSSECCDTKDVCVRDRQQGTCKPQPTYPIWFFDDHFHAKRFFENNECSTDFLVLCLCREGGICRNIENAKLNPEALKPIGNFFLSTMLLIWKKALIVHS